MYYIDSIECVDKMLFMNIRVFMTEVFRYKVYTVQETTSDRNPGFCHKVTPESSGPQRMQGYFSPRHKVLVSFCWGDGKQKAFSTISISPVRVTYIEVLRN